MSVSHEIVIISTFCLDVFNHRFWISMARFDLYRLKNSVKVHDYAMESTYDADKDTKRDVLENGSDIGV